MRDLIRRLDPGGTRSGGLDELVERFFDALADDFRHPAARAVLFEWVCEANRRLDAGEQLGPGRLREMLDALGLEGLLDAERATARPTRRRCSCWREREEARAARDFAAADARRDELAERGWEVRDTPEGARLVRAGDRLRPQPGARGAARAAQREAGLGDAERRPGGLARRGETSTRVDDAELEQLCGSPEHQGICADAGPYPYADPGSLLAAEDALVVCLDQVQDPHNLGAICRVAECAGAAGRGDSRAALRGGHAGRLQGVRGRGRAPAGRPRAQPGRLARRGEEAGAWVYGADGGRRCPTTQPDYTRPGGARARLRGTRPAAARGRGLRRAGGAAAARAVESLNVSAAAAALVYGILHFRARALDRAP